MTTPISETFSASGGSVATTPEYLAPTTYFSTPNPADPAVDTTTTTTIPLPSPGALAVGQILLAELTPKTSGWAVTATPPGTWTLLHKVGSDPNFAPDTAVYWHAVTAAEADPGTTPSTFTFTINNAREITAALRRFKNCNTTTPFDVAFALAIGGSAPIVAPAVTPVTAGALIIQGVSPNTSSRLPVWPAGHVDIFSTPSSDRMIGFATKGVHATPNTSTGTTTIGLNPANSSIQWAAWTAALRPAVGSARTPWPAEWLISTGGSASVTDTEQINGVGRMTLPAGAATYPSIAARREINVADLDVTLRVAGTFNRSNGDTMRHYREIHYRAAATDAIAASTANGYLLTIEPTTIVDGQWNVYLRRTVGGVRVRLAVAPPTVVNSVSSLKVRIRAVGNRHQAKVWDAAQSEPSTWGIDHLDTEASAINTAGAFAVMGVGGNALSPGLTIDWDDIVLTVVGADPAITAAAPARTIWDDPIPLTASGSNFTSVSWAVKTAPAGSVATIVNPTSATTATFTPDKAGPHVFTVTATNATGGVTSDDVEVDVRAQLWQRTATGKVPVAINYRDV